MRAGSHQEAKLNFDASYLQIRQRRSGETGSDFKGLQRTSGFLATSFLADLLRHSWLHVPTLDSTLSRDNAYCFHLFSFFQAVFLSPSSSPNISLDFLCQSLPSSILTLCYCLVVHAFQFGGRRVFVWWKLSRRVAKERASRAIETKWQLAAQLAIHLAPGLVQGVFLGQWCLHGLFLDHFSRIICFPLRSPFFLLLLPPIHAHQIASFSAPVLDHFRSSFSVMWTPFFLVVELSLYSTLSSFSGSFRSIQMFIIKMFAQRYEF